MAISRIMQFIKLHCDCVEGTTQKPIKLFLALKGETVLEINERFDFCHEIY